jgi:hypothetical protein
MKSLILRHTKSSHPAVDASTKSLDVDVAEGGDTDGTDASDLETGTSRRKFEDYKLICYPWAVVEVKKPGASPQDTEECYYQVANGSSACVALLRGLSDSPAHDYYHPVVAMTFVGRDARVSLTYAEPLNGDDDILYVSLVQFFSKSTKSKTSCRC